MTTFPSMHLDYPAIAKLIDHALLAPTLTTAEVDAGLRLARAYDVASVASSLRSFRERATPSPEVTCALERRSGFRMAVNPRK